MLHPCGPECQLLGPIYYACGGNNVPCIHSLWVGSCPTQLLFYAALERMTAEFTPATYVSFLTWAAKDVTHHQIAAFIATVLF